VSPANCIQPPSRTIPDPEGAPPAQPPKTRKPPFYANLIGGGVAGVVGTSIMFPMDMVKTRLQNQKTGTLLPRFLLSSLPLQISPSHFLPFSLPFPYLFLTFSLPFPYLFLTFSLPFPYLLLTLSLPFTYPFLTLSLPSHYLSSPFYF
jgi:hypothetical protein